MQSPERFIRRTHRPNLEDSKVKVQIMRIDKLPRKGVDFRGTKTHYPQIRANSPLDK